MGPHHFRVGALLLAMLSTCASARAQKADESGPPESLQVDYHRGPGAPRPLKDAPQLTAFLVDSVSLDGMRWTGLLRTASPRNGVVGFPPLRQGEILAVFGHLFRVEKPGLFLVRIKSDDMPAEIRVAKTSFVVPLMRHGQGSGAITYRNAKGDYEGKTVFVTDILTGEKGERPIATIKVDDTRGEAMKIQEKAELRLGNTVWVVRSIVPAEAESGVIGWVEFGAK